MFDFPVTAEVVDSIFCSSKQRAGQISFVDADAGDPAVIQARSDLFCCYTLHSSRIVGL